ncbi:MAG: hypothetical protein QW767_00580 [Thermoprotei archaeon]
MGLGFGFYWFAYFQLEAGQPANGFLAAYSTLVFWVGVMSVLAWTWLREPIATFIRPKTRRRAIAAFSSYLPVHLVVYGLLLERVLAGLFGYPGGIHSYELYVTYSPVYPVNVLNAFLGLVVTPSVSLVLPPTYGLDLAAYSFAMALIIAVLVAGNVAALKTVGSSCSTKRSSLTYLGLPVLGVVTGASCCLSVPILLDIAVPAAGSLLLTTPVAYLAYLVFPSATALALKQNFNLLTRISTRMNGSLAAIGGKIPFAQGKTAESTSRLERLKDPEHAEEFGRQ